MEIDAGANASLAGNRGTSLLISAAQRGHDESLMQLIATGTRLDAADSSGMTTLKWAVKRRHKTTEHVLKLKRAS